MRACRLQVSGETVVNVLLKEMTMSKVESDRLSDLLLRQGALEKKIAIEKRRIRDHSRVRAAIRSRVLGEALFRLHDQGGLAESVVRDVKADLRARLDPRSAEWESLEDTGFDLVGPLDDPAEPDDSGSQSG
jgi:hypothetical protein